MKLSKLYSNKRDKFDDIKFNSDFNVIFAEVKRPKDSSKDSHNLGKTSLIYLIDFMFLKTFVQGNFLKDNQLLFEDFIFYLELELNDENYLTIKRGVSNNTKISIKVHKEKFQDFRDKKDDFWDESNLDIKRAKKRLNEFFKFDFTLTGEYDYRKGLSYFLRNQADYGDVFQVSKFSSGKHSFWKPYIAKILGFDSELIKEKYDKDEEIAEKEKFKSEFEKTVSIDPEDFDKLGGAIKIKEKEINEKEIKIDEFNFYEKELDLNKELVYQIEEDIAELNTELYRVNYEIEKINLSFENKIDFNIDEIKKIYEEAGIYFKSAFEKDYSELLDFNKKLQEERSKYLIERLQELNKVKQELKLNLIAMNKKRQDILSILKDKDSFSKYKKLQTDLVKEKTQLINLKTQLENLNHSDVIQKKIEKIIEYRSVIIEQIRESIKKSNQKYETIRENFNEIIKYVFNTPAILSIKLNKEGNLDFNANFVKDEKEMIATSQDKGNTYKKILCASFDLSVLIAYKDESFFRFVYHDGILESLDDRKKILFLEKVREICAKDNIQYILTSINHDLPRDENKKLIEFDRKDIVKALHDDGENGRLFKMDKF